MPDQAELVDQVIGDRLEQLSLELDRLSGALFRGDDVERATRYHRAHGFVKLARAALRGDGV